MYCSCSFMWINSLILCPCQFCKYIQFFGCSSDHNFQVHFTLWGSQTMEADHFIHTINDLLLRMSIGGSGYLRWGRGRNLIAPSECSLRTWLDLEPLLMFFICVVTTFLLTEISPGSFHVHCSLEIHAPVTPTDCWLHSGNSEKKIS